MKPIKSLIVLLAAAGLAACVTAGQNESGDPVRALADAINQNLAVGDPPQKIEAFFEQRGIALERYTITPAYHARIPRGAGECDIQVLIGIDEEERFVDSQVQSSCIGVDPTQ